MNNLNYKTDSCAPCGASPAQPRSDMVFRCSQNTEAILEVTLLIADIQQLLVNAQRPTPKAEQPTCLMDELICQNNALNEITSELREVLNLLKG